MRPKQRAPLRKSSRLPPLPTPPDKILLRLWNKNFRKYTKIYRNIQAFAFKVFAEFSFWVSRNGAVQMFFLKPNKNMFPEKFVK